MSVKTECEYVENTKNLHNKVKSVVEMSDGLLLE
jgi:hypothetical protein